MIKAKPDESELVSDITEIFESSRYNFGKAMFYGDSWRGNNEYLVETRFYILTGIIGSLWFITVVKNKFDKQNYEWRMRKW